MTKRLLSKPIQLLLLSGLAIVVGVGSVMAATWNHSVGTGVNMYSSYANAVMLDTDGTTGEANDECFLWVEPSVAVLATDPGTISGDFHLDRAEFKANA